MAQLAVGQGVLPEQICFHAQQPVEKKTFKAVLQFPLTHDLEVLLSIFDRAGIVVPDELQDAGVLTPYVVETCYPGAWGEISEMEMAHTLSLAQAPVHWAEEILSSSQHRLSALALPQF